MIERVVKEGEWVGFDLDRTLAEYHTWRGVNEIGDPIPAMIDLAKSYLNKGIKLKVFTARVWPNLSEGEKESAIKAIQDWTEEHLGQRLEVTNCKDMYMSHYYDDIAVQVVPNTGILVEDMIR